MARAAQGLREVNHALEQIRSEGDISEIPGVALCAIDRLGAIDDRQAPFVGVRVTTGAARLVSAVSRRHRCALPVGIECQFRRILNADAKVWPGVHPTNELRGSFGMIGDRAMPHVDAPGMPLRSLGRRYRSLGMFSLGMLLIGLFAGLRRRAA